MRRSALPRIALLALIWGSAFLWIKLADRGFSPVEVTLARLALGAATLWAVVLARQNPVPRSLRLWGHIAVAALFANAVPYLLFAVAEQSVNSSTAGIINATTPLWTVLLALAVRHQKTVTSWQAAGLIVGFIGAVVIFEPWSTASGLTSAGALECLAASISYAVSYIYMDRFLAHRSLSPVTLSACQLLAASIMLAIALAFTGAPTPHFTAESVGAIAVLGIVGTGIAYVLNYQIITSEGATIASTVTYLLPVVAIVLGVLVLGESITAIVLGGVALVLAGVALVQQRKWHPRTEVREFVLLMPVALLATLIAGVWAWSLVSPQFAAAPKVSYPGTIVIATDGHSTLGQKTLTIGVLYSASRNARAIESTISITQIVTAREAKSESPTVIVFLCGRVAKHPRFVNNRFQPVTWHQTMPVGGAVVTHIGALSQCVYTTLTLTPNGRYRSNLLMGSSGPRASQMSGDMVIYAWPGVVTLPSIQIHNLEPAPLEGDSNFTVGLSGAPADLSNVVASPQLPDSGVLQWEGRFATETPIENEYRISANLLNQQSSEQRDLFIAGALVGVAGGGAIWLLELLTKTLLTLRTSTSPSDDSGESTRAEPDA